MTVLFRYLNMFKGLRVPLKINSTLLLNYGILIILSSNQLTSKYDKLIHLKQIK